MILQRSILTYILNNMREIKFRAWDTEEKTMLKPFDLSSNPKYWCDNLKDYPLMQYTGLKDKNGVEIYEGDIVKILDYYNNIGIVEYSAPNFHIFDGDDGATDFDHNDWAYFKVIGNIYKTPELLDKD
jgi:uncharacterized phage protein (TIGR01671 family)